MDLIQLEINRVIKDFKKGRINVGDVVYCTKALQDVILLETPSNEIIEEYERSSFFPSKELNYKLTDGSIGRAPIPCFRRIKKGNFFLCHWLGIGKGLS